MNEKYKEQYTYEAKMKLPCHILFRVCCWGSSSLRFQLELKHLNGLVRLIRLFNKTAWTLGDPPPLLDFLGEESRSVLTLFFVKPPKRNRYATLLADTIFVLAFRNYNNHLLLDFVMDVPTLITKSKAHDFKSLKSKT